MSDLQEFVEQAYWYARAASDDPQIDRLDRAVLARYHQHRAAVLSLADRKLRGVE